MIVLEYKIKAKQRQYQAIDAAIRTGQFVRNKCLRLWMDNQRVNKYDLNKYCRVLAKEYSFAEQLNSTARQSSAERAWSSIARFLNNCKKRTPRAEETSAQGRSKQKIPDKKVNVIEASSHDGLPEHQADYPKFKKYSRSVEYKQSGWKLDPQTKKHITFTDKNHIGRVKLVGSRDIYFYHPEQIKRVRLVRRADGYYCQFGISIEVKEDMQPTRKAIGLDMGLKYFYADSHGHIEENPRFYRQNEKRLKRLNRRKSLKYRCGVPRQSHNYHKARQRYAKLHLRVSRQREEHAKKLARCVCASNDCIAYEDLNVTNLVRNHSLSKGDWGGSDDGWSQFRKWLEYFGWKFGKITIAVPPHYTSQDCPVCGAKIKKSLSTRTHVCKCGYIEDRDIAASINILKKGLSTAGHVGTYGAKKEVGFSDSKNFFDQENAWGETSSSSVGAILLGYGDSPNQESIKPPG